MKVLSIRSPSKSSAAPSPRSSRRWARRWSAPRYSTNIKERRDCSTALFDAARRDAVPGRAHPDASRQLHRHHPAHPAAPPGRGRCGPATSSSATTPTRAAARICPTSCSPSRSSSTASIVAWAVNTRPPCRLRRSRPRPHLPGGPAHPADPPLSRRRAAGGRAGPDPAELPGAARAAVRPARPDGGQPARRAALPGAVRRSTARDTVLAAGEALHGLRRAQDARRHRRHARRHLPLRGRVRQRRGRAGLLPILGRDHGEGRGDDACISSSPPQVRAGINMVYTALLATVYYAVKSVRRPDHPAQRRPGAAAEDRPRPKARILNCLPPAAVNGRLQTCQRVVDLILRRAGPGGARARHGLPNSACTVA